MMHTKNGGARIDTDLMLASGAITGPHRKPRPVRVTTAQRAMTRVVAGLKRLDAWQMVHRWQCREFASVYRQYRKHHGRLYSARIAYGIAFKGMPF